MPYAMHLRKSRADLEAEARGEGESLARHRKTLQDLAQRLNLDIVAEYCEIISGDRLSERPEMQRLLKDVSAGLYDGVLDVEISRLTRGDLMDQGLILNTFKYSSTKIITPQHTYNLSEDWDEDHLTTDMMLYRREYKFIKRRLQAGRTSSATEGLWQSPAPLGYKKVKIQRGKGWTLEPDPETVPIVRLIFDMYANQKLGGGVIANQLNAMGSRTPRGHLWTANAIRALSSNPVYIGKVRWNDRISVTRIVDGQLVVKREKCAAPIISDGKHPAIIPEEWWYAAQRTRESHDRTRTHNSKPTQNPLAGLVFCAHCGKSMIRKDNCGTKNGSRYPMLRCTTKECPTKSIALSIVEQTILDTLDAWVSIFSQPDSHFAPSEDPRREAIETARANIEKLQAQRDRIFAAFEDGTYDSATFVKRRNEKDAEIEAARRALESLQDASALSTEQIIKLQLPAIQDALKLYAVASEPIEKNRILKTVVSRVVYKKTKRCFRNQDPSKELSLTIYPKSP